MAANKLAYILDKVQTALATESSFTVQKVLNKSRQPTPGRVLVYPFVVAASQTPVVESGQGAEGVCTIRIWSDVPVASEGVTPTGKSYAAFADTIAKIEKAMRSLAIPSQETHTDGTSTAIVGANVTLIGGHVDNGDNKIEADCDVTILYRWW